MPKIMIIGAGAGGTALLPILNDYKEIKVAGIADTDGNAPGLALAKKMGIPTSDDFQKLLTQIDANIIINASGNIKVSQKLDQIRKERELEIIEGDSAKVLFELVDAKIQSEKEALHRLHEHEALYKIGIMLTSSESEDELLNTIIKWATRLTHTPAGSIALYDSQEHDMEIVALHGFKKDFSAQERWPIRKGGLTEYILNVNSPLVIKDINEFDLADSSQIKKDGINSLIAIPLIVERTTIGILYVDDFIARDFSKRDEAILTLLGTQAAIAIEKMQLFEKAKRLAITDGLTGLYNHRYFVKQLRDELLRAKRYTHELSVLIIDIDHFKNYNDTNGHLQGNEAIKIVTRVMKDVTRTMDVLSRYGGEEFAVILPETNKQQALQTAIRICKSVEEEKVLGEEKQPLKKLTISVGVAVYPEDATHGAALIECADQGLYQAKHEGRNRVVAYECQDE
ncbi:diguanylate cyclase [Pseudomonadota bacterium]